MKAILFSTALILLSITAAAQNTVYTEATKVTYDTIKANLLVYEIKTGIVRVIAGWEVLKKYEGTWSMRSHTGIYLDCRKRPLKDVKLIQALLNSPL